MFEIRKPLPNGFLELQRKQLPGHIIASCRTRIQTANPSNSSLITPHRRKNLSPFPLWFLLCSNALEERDGAGKVFRERLVGTTAADGEDSFL